MDLKYSLDTNEQHKLTFNVANTKQSASGIIKLNHIDILYKDKLISKEIDLSNDSINLKNIIASLDKSLRVWNKIDGVDSVDIVLADVSSSKENTSKSAPKEKNKGNLTQIMYFIIKDKNFESLITEDLKKIDANKNSPVIKIFLDINVRYVFDVFEKSNYEISTSINFQTMRNLYLLDDIYDDENVFDIFEEKILDIYHKLQK